MLQCKQVTFDLGFWRKLNPFFSASLHSFILTLCKKCGGRYHCHFLSRRLTFPRRCLRWFSLWITPLHQVPLFLTPGCDFTPYAKKQMCASQFVPFSYNVLKSATSWCDLEMQNGSGVMMYLFPAQLCVFAWAWDSYVKWITERWRSLWWKSFMMKSFHESVFLLFLYVTLIRAL